MNTNNFNNNMNTIFNSSNSVSLPPIHSNRSSADSNTRSSVRSSRESNAEDESEKQQVYRMQFTNPLHPNSNRTKRVISAGKQPQPISLEVKRPKFPMVDLQYASVLAEKERMEAIIKDLKHALYVYQLIYIIINKYIVN
jgi:hypothetical protein